MELAAYFAIAFILTAVAGSRQKRLVLHSDTDIATEVLNLKSEMENLKTAFSAQVATLTAKHDNSTAKLQAEIDSLTENNNKLSNNLSATFQAELRSQKDMFSAKLQNQATTLTTKHDNTTAKLQAEIASLTANNNKLNSNLSDTIQAELLRLNVTLTTKHDNATAKLQAEIANLTASNNKLTNELSSLQSAFNTETNHEHGSVYVRWGRTVCPGNVSTLVYKGYMAGSDYTETGNGANHLCLPEDPTWAKYTDANDGTRATIHGTEFNGQDEMYFDKHVYDQDVPCAVCQISGVSVMIPARTNCYPGWNVEYTGYLMAQYYGYEAPTEFACVDADPEFVPRGHANTNGHLLQLVQSRCGTLVCPPYYDFRELACSVCSK